MISKEEAKTAAPLLWHDSRRPMSLGCVPCPDRPLCGGLYVEGHLFSCLDHCSCEDKACCDVVCPRNRSFARRVHEVQGLSLDNIEERPHLALPQLPDVLPLFYRSPKILQRIYADVAVIPFNEAYRRRGKLGVPLTRSELEAKFKISRSTRIVLCGIEKDEHVEQWWSSGGRKELLTGIKALGVIFATTPNFSTMSDVPRHDNLHAQKRIGLAWAELHDAGIPTAFHINGRTDKDFENTERFLCAHDEIQAIAAEFTTGAAFQEWGSYFTTTLADLAQKVGRPLTLVLRGGVQWLPELSPHFGRILVIDTSSAMGAIKRRRAVLVPGGRIKWRREPTERGTPLDEMLASNLRTMSQWLTVRRNMNIAPEPANGSTRAGLEVESDANHETVQGTLL